jgi:carboxylesterase
VEAAHDMLRERCDTIVAGGLSMGGILAIHLARNRPESVHGLLLFAPTLRLDGWSMPWYSRALHYVRPLPIKLEFDLAEREPYGLKDERARAGVPACRAATRSAGVFNADAIVRQFQCAGRGQARPQSAAAAFIVHPREDDMASLENAQYLQTHLGGLVETLVLDNSYHMVTLDQQRHIVAERTERFVNWLENHIAAKDEVDRRLGRGVVA